jgi:hypothetical protein
MSGISYPMYLFSVSRIQDVNPRSRIRFFSIPESRIQIFYLGSASKNLNILTQKIVNKLLEIWPGCSSRIRIFSRIQGQKRIPDPDPQHYLFWTRVGTQWSGMICPRSDLKIQGIDDPTKNVQGYLVQRQFITESLKALIVIAITVER